ncbi:MAG TPA: hypothetical protein VGL93_18855 [Streptosporangiaceae bacterium]
MEYGQAGGVVASWSAHHLPAGSSVRCVLNAEHDDAPIRLVIGDLEQVELEMALPEAAAIVAALRDVERDLKVRSEVTGGRSEP